MKHGLMVPHWLRRTAQLYGAALGMTLSQLSAPPEAKIRTRPPIVRMAHAERLTERGFDPREEVSPGVILTVPLDEYSERDQLAAGQPVVAGASRFHVN